MIKFLISISIEKILEIYMAAYLNSLSMLNEEERDTPLHGLELAEMMSMDLSHNRDVVLSAFHEDLMAYFLDTVKEEYSDSDLVGLVEVSNTEEWRMLGNTRLILPPNTTMGHENTATLLVLYNLDN